MSSLQDLELLYKKDFKKYVNMVMFRFSLDKDEAQDVVQNTFVYLIKSISSHDPSLTKLSSWVYMAVSSRAKKYLKEKKTRFEKNENYSSMIDESYELDIDRDIDIERLQVRKKIEYCIDNIETAKVDRETVKKILRLRLFENKQFKYIAEDLNMNISTVKTLYHKFYDILEKNITSPDFIYGDDYDN